jgi:hypothetical protein
MRRRRPIAKSRTKKPAADFSARVNQTRLDDVTMPVFCPTCQTLCCARLPPHEADMKKPAADWCARANQTRFDDAILPVFCPTCQRGGR